MYPFRKDASFCPCFCFVHTIAQFSRILIFSHIYCQIFRIRTHGWRKWRPTALTSTIGSEKFQKFKFIFFFNCSGTLHFNNTSCCHFISTGWIQVSRSTYFFKCLMLHFVFNSIPSSYVRVATPLSEMSWTSYGPFHDFSILDPLLDHFLVLKSKTLSPFFILSDFESTFLFFAYCFFCFSCDSVTFVLLLI